MAILVQVLINGDTFSSLRINHSIKAVQRLKEYLPPPTTESYAEKSINYNVNTIGQPVYQPQLVDKMSYPLTQYSSKIPSNMQQSPKTFYNSYAAPASGSAPYLYSMPLPANMVPLPKLFPKSLVNQYSPVATAQPQLQIQHQRPQNYQQVQQQQQYADLTKQFNDLPLSNTTLLMVAEPTAALLTPSQNLTLEAARILASTLLQANEEAPLETPGLAPLSNPNALALSNHLNSTDVLVVKSQKNAYIIPTPLAKDACNPSHARALYQMRNKLDKAYTINQFIFIIKPKRINFLNKLI